MPIPALVLAAVLLASGSPATGGGAPAAAGDAAYADVRARARALLGAIDRPVSAEAFRRLGPDVEAALADIARSHDYPAFRGRALEALAALGAAGAEGLHRELASDGAAPRPVRRAAVRGLARLLAPGPATAALSPLLERDADPAIRSAAAEALARAAPSEGCGAVRRQAAREGDRRAAAFARAVAVCDRARAGRVRDPAGGAPARREERDP
jgi:hypothetical protein